MSGLHYVYQTHKNQKSENHSWFSYFHSVTYFIAYVCKFNDNIEDIKTLLHPECNTQNIKNLICIVRLCYMYMPSSNLEVRTPYHNDDNDDNERQVQVCGGCG